MGKYTWIVVLVCVILVALAVIKCSNSPQAEEQTESKNEQQSEPGKTSSDSESQAVAGAEGGQAEGEKSESGNAGGGGSEGEKSEGGQSGGGTESSAGGQSSAGSEGENSGGGGAGSGSGGGGGGSGGGGSAEGAAGGAGQGAGDGSEGKAAGASNGGASSPTGGSAAGSANGGGGGAADSGDREGWAETKDEVPGGTVAIIYPKAPPVQQPPDLDVIKLEVEDPRRELIGVWTQSAGSADGDFAHGGYSQTTLVFTTAGKVEVTRFYGSVGAQGALSGNAIKKSLQLDYAVKDGAITFSAPARKGVPDRRTLDLVDSQGKTWKASAPQSLPLTLRYVHTEGTLSIGGKTYKRVQSTK